MVKRQKHTSETAQEAVETAPARLLTIPAADAGFHCQLSRVSADYPDLTPACVEALAGYLYNQKCVPQEVTHPSGAIERQAPLQPDLSPVCGDISRFLYQTEAWYDHMLDQLQRIHDAWESWMDGVFSCVERDESTGATTYWTVRDFAGKDLSIWSLQIEQDSGQHQGTTFAVFHEITDAVQDAPDGSHARAQRVLLKTYRTYRQRIHRILHLLRHLSDLGMRSAQEYSNRCTRCGLSPELHKTAQQRRQEHDRLRAGNPQSDSAWFRESATRICAGEATEADLRTDYLASISRAFAGGLAGGARRAYLDLLLHAEQHANLFALQPAIPCLGRHSGNTFVEGLAELARRYRSWLRPLADWRPDAYNPRRQFASLARHLIARYDVPVFMDAAWCRGRSALAQRQQGWFLHMANGQNIRTADIPVTFSKKMAHQFLQAPARYTIEEALRWGQIVGQGGPPELVEAVLATPLGTSFENEDFWSTVIHFMTANSMLDPDCVGPIVDFIHYRKYARREIVNPGGEIALIDPPEPNFSMKSRSVAKLLDQMEAWHARLAREERVPTGQWTKSPIPDFIYSEKDIQNGGALRWSIRELLSQNALKSEGREMRHCVASYAGNCKKGKTSVWSLQVTNGLDETFRLATIAVDPQNRRITQLRGRFNLKPSMSSRGLTFKAGLDDQYAMYLIRARDILRVWVNQEHLGKTGSDLNAWIAY